MSIIEFMTYEEWLDTNPDIDTDEKQKCPMCSGVGYFEHTDNYGNVATFYCEACRGTGKVNKSFILYKKQLNKDKKKALGNWLENLKKEE